MGLSKIYAGCRKCPYIDTCNHKSMEIHGHLMSAATDASLSAAMPVMRDLSTVTINLGDGCSIDVLREDVKKELEKHLHIGLEYGA